MPTASSLVRSNPQLRERSDESSKFIVRYGQFNAASAAFGFAHVNL